MKYKIKITETYSYYIAVDDNNKKEALTKAHECYENSEDNYTRVANANTLEKTQFTVLD